MAGRYDKYIDLEFGYTCPQGRNYTMTYYGKTTDTKGFDCTHCGKPLRGAGHTFTEQENSCEVLFGSECVKHVFAAGLTKLAATEKKI